MNRAELEQHGRKQQPETSAARHTQMAIFTIVSQQSHDSSATQTRHVYQ
jgi:hypothetical protein